MANTNNFYQLKREAAQSIQETIEYLEQKPEKAIKLQTLLIEFQSKFGFTEKVLRSLLEPYLKLKKVQLQDEHLTSYKKQEA